MKLFKDLLHPDDSDYSIDVDDNVKVFYRPLSETGKTGFYFYATEFNQCETSATNICKNDTLKVDCLFHGYALWDGVRHLSMGDKETENENYLYYPGLSSLTKVFEVLKGLQDKYCNDD